MIMNSNNVVASADVFGYEVKLPAGEAFTSFGAFGADSVSSATAMNIDRFTWEVTDTNFTGTSTKYEGSFVSGYNHAQIGLTSGGAVGDPRYDIDDVTTDGTNANGNIDLAPYTIKYFSNPRYLPNSDQASNIGLPAESL